MYLLLIIFNQDNALVSVPHQSFLSRKRFTNTKSFKYGELFSQSDFSLFGY